MKKTLITILRDKNTSRAIFRATTDKLASILAEEVSQFLEKEKCEITTSFQKTEGIKLKNKIMFVPILRSGIALVTTFLRYYEDAAVGCIGLRRDEVTAKPALYYQNIPKFTMEYDIILLDPMIATGGSGEAALNILLNLGIREEKIIYVSVIAAEFGINFLKNKFNKVKFILTQVDPELNDKKFIMPGLGDFGDRFFGTE